MSSESDSNSKRNRLPFEPLKSKSKSRSASDQQPTGESDHRSRGSGGKSSSKNSTSKNLDQSKTIPSSKSIDPKPTKSTGVDPKPGSKANTDIPEVITRRMMSRMGLFCGLPSISGILVFLVSYQAVTHDWFRIPTVGVLFISLGCFGLGVAGLSYGALSASWDEDKPGSLLGWSEFMTNFGRMTSAWKESGERNKQKR